MKIDSQTRPISRKWSKAQAPVVPRVAQTFSNKNISPKNNSKVNLKKCFYKERDEPLLAILGNGLGQRIAAHGEIVVTLDVAQFDQSDQSGLLHRAVSLSEKEILFLTYRSIASGTMMITWSEQ